MQRIGKRRRIGERFRVRHIKRFGHVQPIQPHLLRVDLFVPEAAFSGARLRAELTTQRFNGGAVAGVFRPGQERKEQPPLIDLVEIELVFLVANDGTLGIDEAVHVAADVIGIVGPTRRFANAVNRQQDQAGGVVPACADSGISRDQRVGHANRPGHGRWSGRARRRFLGERDVRCRGRDRAPHECTNECVRDAPTVHDPTLAPLIVTLVRVSASTCSSTSGFATPSKRQSMRRIFRIGACSKPRR